MKTRNLAWLPGIAFCLVAMSAQADPILVEDWEGDTIIQQVETISGDPLQNLGEWYAFVNGTPRWELTTENCEYPCEGTYANHPVPPDGDHTNTLYYGIAGPFVTGMTIDVSFDYVSSNRDASIFLLGLTDGLSEISPYAPWWNGDYEIQLLADGGLDSSAIWTNLAASTTLTSDYDAIAFVVVMGGSTGLRGIDNINVSTVPEPATLALFGLGLAGIGFSRRRKA